MACSDALMFLAIISAGAFVGAALEQETETVVEQPSEEARQMSLDKACESADYIFVGKLIKFESLGPTRQEGELPKWFFRLHFEADEKVHGDLIADSGDTGQTVPPNYQALYWTHQEDFSLTEDSRCLFALKRMQAGAMQGTVPTTTLLVRPFDKDDFESAKQAAAERAEGTKKPNKQSR